MEPILEKKEKEALNKLRRVAAALGASVTIDRSCGCNELRVTAPAGQIFGTEQLHEFVDCSYKPWQPDYEDALARLQSSPPEPCTIPECEWCENN